jgi:MFS family permease
MLSESLMRRYGRKHVYRIVCGSALVITAGLLASMSLVHRHSEIVILSSLGFGVMDLMLPSAWAMCMSLGGQFGGTATAIMNTGGNLGGWVCTVAFGYLLGATFNYNLPLRVIAGMVLIAAVLFTMVDCTQSLGDDLRISRSE